MNSKLIYGDIEGNPSLSRIVLDSLSDSVTNQMIFLGDLFDARCVDVSLDLIERIMTHFDIPITTRFTSDNVLDTLKYECNSIRSCKGLDKYADGKYNKWKSLPHERNYSYKSFPNAKCIFIMGNKEAIMPETLHNSDAILLNEEGTHVTFHYKYIARNPDNYKEFIRVPTILVLSIHQLNVLFAYMHECHNYIVMDNILYIHCYLNARFVRCKYTSIICGHNKGYGKFEDSKCKNKVIYMNDFTVVDDINAEINGPIHITVNNGNIELGFTNKSLPNGLYSLALL